MWVCQTEVWQLIRWQSLEHVFINWVFVNWAKGKLLIGGTCYVFVNCILQWTLTVTVILLFNVFYFLNINYPQLIIYIQYVPKACFFCCYLIIWVCAIASGILSFAPSVWEKLSTFRERMGLTLCDQNIICIFNSTNPRAKNIINISPACIIFMTATQALDVIFPVLKQTQQ